MIEKLFSNKENIIKILIIFYCSSFLFAYFSDFAALQLKQWFESFLGLAHPRQSFTRCLQGFIF